MQCETRAVGTCEDLEFYPDGRIYRPSTGDLAEPNQHYHVNDRTISTAFGQAISADFADLVGLAMAIYSADRIVARRPRQPNPHRSCWTREFKIRLRVRNIAHWCDGRLLNLLRDTLWYFTEDDWQFEFVPLTSDADMAERQGFLFPFPPEPPVTAALFSGGLDSLCGLCQEIAARPHHTFVLFSGITNQETGAIQRRLVEALREHFRLDARRLMSVSVPFGLRQREERTEDGERTQRSRGFVFLALGAVAALMAGANSLDIYENGPGAINLPYTEAQLGTHNTRAMHPRALAMMGKLIAEVTGQEFALRNQSLFQTKGELCASLGDLGLGWLAGQTISCDRFPQRVSGHPQCGLCTSCLLRRQALSAANLNQLENWRPYRHDIFQAPTLSSPELYPFRAMDHQVSRIRAALQQPDPWHALTIAYPEIFEVALVCEAQGTPQHSVENQLISMYRRYCNEWGSFAAQGPPASPKQAA